MEPSVGVNPAFAEYKDSGSLRIAMAASIQGCFGQGRRGADNTVASRLLLALQELINRFADQPGNRKVLSDRDFLKFRKLLGLQSY